MNPTWRLTMPLGPPAKTPMYSHTLDSNRNAGPLESQKLNLNFINEP